MKSVATFHMIKIGLAAAAIALIVAFAIWDRRKLKSGRWVAGLVLAIVAFFSVVAYFDFGYYPKFGQFINPHDFFHYYLGSKYSREVGYLNLYPSVLVADAEENGGTPRHGGLRRMEDYNFEPAAKVMLRAAEYRALFSDARWTEFKADIGYFREILGKKKRWAGVLGDKGYNATPVWNAVARLLTSQVPPSDIPLLASLDLLLLAIMFILIGLAFGWRTSLLAVVFFGSMFMMAYTHIRGAFLRLDWVTLLVMSTCMLKMKRYKTAGALMAYSGMARIFPLIFGFGMGAKFFWDILRTRRLDRRYLAYFVSFGVTCVVLVLFVIVSDRGVAHWHDFFTKIGLHDRDLSPMRVGFRYVFLMSYKNAYGSWTAFEAAKLKVLADYKLLWWAIQAAVALVALFAARKLDDYETIPFGYVLAFFLTAPTFYYQVMIIVLLMLYLPKIEQAPRAIGASLLFAVSIIAFLLNREWKLQLELSFWLSCMLMAVVLYTLGFTLALSWPASISELLGPSGFSLKRVPDDTSTPSPSEEPSAPRHDTPKPHKRPTKKKGKKRR